jgi:nitrogen fixation NifU-like protein
MPGSTNINCRQSDGSRQIEEQYHSRRMEIMNRMGGVCHAGIKDFHGKTMEIYLGTNEGLIVGASFLTNECNFSILSAYTASKLAIGATADEALKIDTDTIRESLGQIPDQAAYSSRLAAEALHAAIHNWLDSEKEPSVLREDKKERRS